MYAKNKRVVSGYNLADMLLFEWIDLKSFGGTKVFEEAQAKLIAQMKEESFAEKVRKYGAENFLTSYCWSIVNVRIAYIGDTEQFNRVDWWELPTECYNWMKGDCEDSTFLLSAALESIREVAYKPYEYKYLAVLGFYCDAQGNYYGHGFVLYYNSYLQKWCVLETTWDKEVNPFIWINWNPEMYVPAVLFDRRTVLRMDVESHRQQLGLQKDWYERHKEMISAMIDYITLAKKMKVSWMHKTVRPVPVDLSCLEVMM